MIKNSAIDTTSLIVSLAVDQDLFDNLSCINQSMITCIEIQSSDSVLLKQIIHDFPTLCIGASLITTVQHLEECHRIGINFMSSPGFLASIAHTASIYD